MTMNAMQVEFFGAAGEVTGSCFLVHALGRRILVECGLIQGSPAHERRNRDPFPFDVAGIDAVVLTHAHLDHSGRLPLLMARGFDGPIWTHRATAELCAVLLQDAAYLSEKDAEWENRKRERKGLAPVEPLYSVEQARQTQRLFRPLDYDSPTEILPGLRLTLRDAGRIRHSNAMLNAV
ncbi:MAG: MBL fold metallo-hydrolase [Gammaproteobacteria bacterium]|nr:MBL fold metallo-hydrolase [Gammaproteobacteria bacterium]